MIEGTPSKSALFVNGTIGGYIPTNVRNSRYVPAYDYFIKNRKYINRSLSHKGCPFDNAVAESTYKSLKVEFVYQYTFETLQELDLELFDYVNWWNHLRLHGTLGYETPVGYRNQKLAQRILDNELGCANASEAV